MKMKQAGWIISGLLLWNSASAIDSGLYQRYNEYKSYRQSQQVEELSRARSAANAGDFQKAERHLEAARNMAYSPDEIRSVENLIAEERGRRERLAEQERRRKEQLAKQERRAREQAARAAAAGEAASKDCIQSISDEYRTTDIIDGTPQRNVAGRCSNGEGFGCVGTDEWGCSGPYSWSALSTNLLKAVRMACGCSN